MALSVGSLAFLTLKVIGDRSAATTSQSTERGLRRPPLFTGIDTKQGLFLLFRCPLVYMNDNPPVTFQHVSGDVDDEGHGKAG